MLNKSKMEVPDGWEQTTDVKINREENEYITSSLFFKMDDILIGLVEGKGQNSDQPMLNIAINVFEDGGKANILHYENMLKGDYDRLYERAEELMEYYEDKFIPEMSM